jgi:hypothetical protein
MAGYVKSVNEDSLRLDFTAKAFRQFSKTGDA